MLDDFYCEAGLSSRQTVCSNWIRGVLATRQRDRVERLIIIALAGPYAEKHFTDRWNHAGASWDRRFPGDVSFSVCGSKRESRAYDAWLTMPTRDLIDSFWTGVEGVAKALLEHRTLNEDGVRSAVENALDPPKQRAERERHAAEMSERLG